MGRKKHESRIAAATHHDRAGQSREGSESLSTSDMISALRNENRILNAKIAALTKELTNLRNENHKLQNKSRKNDGRVKGQRRGDMLVVHAEICTLTDVDVLSVGLSYCGFDAARQQRVNLDRNLRRFKSFFGVPPTTVAPILRDLKDANSKLVLKDILMSMNWLYLYETREVLSGRWGPHENEIGSKVVEQAKEIQKLKAKKIKLEFGDSLSGEHPEYPASLDTCNFETQEFRLDPSAKWYDPKSHSSGLVSVFF